MRHESYFPNKLDPVHVELNFDYNQRFLKYLNSMAWLKEIGIRVKNTRFEKYLDALDYERRIIVFSEEDAKLYDYANSLREIDELNWIAESFDNVKLSDDLLALLRKIVSGNIYRNKDKKSNSARDTAFHLRMAGYFARSNTFVDVENPWDVEAKYQNRKIVLEAKRVTSLKKISKRIGEANKQISKNSKSTKGERDFGIIALDVYEFLFGSNIVNSFENLEQSTKSIREMFSMLPRTSWVGSEVDKLKKTSSKVYLVWVNALVPCYLEEENVYVTRFQSVFIPIKSNFTIDGQFSQNLTDYLALYFEKPQRFIT